MAVYKTTDGQWVASYNGQKKYTTSKSKAMSEYGSFKNPTQQTTQTQQAPQKDPSTMTAQERLEDIKSQARTIVTAAQKQDPNIKISEANAEMIGMPQVDIPTQKEDRPRPASLDMVGTTPAPRTSQEIARDAILSQVPEEDRDTISQILDTVAGYQTERGAELESTAESILTQQLANIQATRDRARESSEMQEAEKIPELQAELESIRSEADVLQARRNAAIQAEEAREGVSTSARSGNVANIARDFDLQQANLAIRELASVGKINAATKLIEAKLDLKYGDLEAETNLLTAQLNAISPFLSREDQKAAETRLQLNEIVKNTIADAREEDKALEEMKLQSYLYAQQNGASPAILSSIMSSESREDVLSVGGSYIQDPMQKLQMEQTRLGMEATRQSIATSRASELNTYDQIATRAEANKQMFGTINGKAQTQSEKTAEGYAIRTLESGKVIDQYGNMFTRSIDRLKKFTPNELLSEEYQKYEQAQRNFVNAVLRRESGAVISDEEFANARLQYFPQPGDSAGVIEQKKQNRDTVISNLFNEGNVPMPELEQQVTETTPLQSGFQGTTSSGLGYTIL